MTDTPRPRRPGRPRREESGDVDRMLVDAAIHMVAQHGPALTMNMIIAASGLSRKTVYTRFPNKAAVMAAVVRQMLDHGLEPLAVPDGADWRERLVAYVDLCLNEVCLPQAMALRRLLMIDPGFMEQMKPRIEQVVVRRYMDPLAAFLDAMARDGRMAADDVGFAAQSLTNLILSESHRRFFQNDVDVANDARRLSDLARRMVGLLSDGVISAGAAQVANRHNPIRI